MRRIIAIVLALSALLCFLATMALAAAPEAPGEALEMKYPGDQAKYAPIMFQHTEAHLGVEGGCETCHHTWDGQSEIASCSADGCHNDISRENKREPTSYDSAFHSRKAPNSCVGCHSAMLKADASFKGPKKCNDCHSRK
jgi:hypothetical protein